LRGRGGLRRPTAPRGNEWHSFDQM
jgi:hypothetical protein